MVIRVPIALLLAAAALTAQTAEQCEKALERWDFAGATRLARALVLNSPGSARAHVLLGRALMGTNEPQPALNELNRAAKLAPGNLDALYYLSKLTGVLSQQQYLAVLQLAPDSARAHQLRAEGLAAHNEAAEAEREYLAALEKKPDASSVLVALGELKRLEGEYSDALGWYRKALVKAPGFYDALYGAGACYYLLKDQASALEYFRRALTADPSSDAARLAMGQTLLFLQRPAEALPLLEAAVKADPNLKRVYYMLGRAYTAVGRKDDAAKSFERFRSIKTPEPEEDALALGTQP
jgi:tetratricopeptide (TPR) repeat protein